MQIGASLTATTVNAHIIVAINSTINADVKVNIVEIQEYPLRITGMKLRKMQLERHNIFIL